MPNGAIGSFELARAPPLRQSPTDIDVIDDLHESRVLALDVGDDVGLVGAWRTNARRWLP